MERMEKEMIFHILGIPETGDEGEIRRAYMELLRSVNPEDDPEGFKRLRQAYEEALAFARQKAAPEDADEGEKEPKSEVELWLERVDTLYKDLMSRADVERWEAVLSDPVGEGLDTSLEAREKLLAYLMGHIRLPHSIWQRIDRHFAIMGDMEALKQDFPRDFLHYVAYYIEHDTFIPYELFRYSGPQGEEIKGDAYIDAYLAVKRQIDGGEAKGGLEALDDLKAYHIYHPYEDVERMRLYSGLGQTQEALRLAEALLASYPEDTYIRFYAGDAKWKGGEKEAAFQLWDRLLKADPDHYSAKLGVARCYMDQGKPYEARELMLELLDNGRNEEVEALIQKANEALIQEFKETLASGRTDPRLTREELIIKLGWCLFQNERIGEAVDLLKDMEPDKEEYLYCNLYGRLLYQMDRNEEALPYLERWLELIRGLTDDGTKETRKRISRHGGACYILSGCYHALGRQEDAERSLHEAIGAAVDLRDRLEYTQYLANILLWSGQYARSVDICDQILEEDDQYYPAVLTRQEASYKLHKSQQVVDDYHKAVRIYPGYYKPYLFAAKVFFYYEQYEDAKGVIDRAKEEQVEFSPEFKLFQVKILRNLAGSREERDAARQLLEEIRGELDREDCDIEDKSEVSYETGLLWWDDDELDLALEHLTQAIAQNPGRLQYRLIRGDIDLEMKKYEEALLEYQAAEPDYGERPGVHYSMGRCFEGLGEKEKAIACFEKVFKMQNGYRDANEKLSDYHKDRYEDFADPKDLEKALYYIDKQLEVKENCYYLVCRGLIYDGAMEQEKAIADYQKALEYSVRWIVWNNMGCSYKYMKRYEEAIRCCEKALEVLGEEKDRMPYRNLADCYTALGDLEKAIGYYKKGLEVTPDYGYFWERIGDLYYELGQLEEALEAYSHTKDRDHHYGNIGDVWLKRGDRERCIQCYEEGILKADGDRQKAVRLSSLGDLYMEELLDYKKAVTYFQRAADLEKDDYELFDYERYLARAYLMLGRKVKAKEHALKSFRHFVESGRDRDRYLAFKAYAPARLASFGGLYLCMGDRELARQYFTKMDQVGRCKNCRYDGCFESFLYMGYHALCGGDKEEALRQFEKASAMNPYNREAKCMIRSLKIKERGDEEKL